MFSCFCDSFCCCLYRLRRSSPDTQDSSINRNREFELNARPISSGVYPTLADTTRDYSRRVDEQPGPSSLAPVEFQHNPNGAAVGDPMTSSISGDRESVSLYTRSAELLLIDLASILSESHQIHPPR